jgi:energy-coupling factor transporter ATP-binding protein EcfA2
MPVTARSKSPRYSTHSSEIPVSRTSYNVAAKSGGQHRGSVSTGSKEVSNTRHDFPKVPPSNSLTTDPQERQSGKICEACDEIKATVWNCANCGMNFCDACWDRQAQHKPGRTGPDGLPHEKADPAIVERLKSILTPPKEQIEQQMLHVEDEDTTWFGMARNHLNQPIFQDYGRYPAMMADYNSGEYKLRFPQLVSFIGQTGAGKSTLIKMLIDQQERHHDTYERLFPSPVVGSLANENVPTSGDVHLYSDPATCYGEFPMLYADCEGLEGGEHLPISAQLCNAPTLHKEKERDSQMPRKGRERRRITRGLHCTQRNIEWADSFEKQKRQYAVTELYPRLLYTFSDVIVFVLRNPKYAQHPTR